MKVLFGAEVRWLLVVAGLAGAAYAQAGYQGKAFQGKAQAIPGRVEMELYDAGGPEVAYHDSDAVNSGSGALNKGDSFVDRFRMDEGVDISYTKKDIDKTVDGAQEKVGDLYLGWTAAGEWVNYTVDVKEAGTYAVRAHMTSRTDDARIALAVDGVDVTGSLRLPGTTHWHIWRVAENLARVKLAAGRHVLKLSVLQEGNFNLDYLEFSAAQAGTEALDAFVQVKQMGRGVNIIGYDPLWRDFSKARFQEKHFRLLREGGFQTVRMNLQAFGYMDAENKLNATWFKTLDWAVEKALANGLTVILDEHNFTACGQDAEACKPKLMAFWTQVSEHFKDADARVVFEILNEPNGKLTTALWNSYAREALGIIRRTNLSRNVIIGPGNWNGVKALAELELPADDRHLIVTVHYYLPMAFTHQGAPWSKENAGRTGVTWGTEDEKRKVDADFAGVQEWAVAAKRPMLLGEFGAYDKADMESRARYDSYVTRSAEKLGWCWTYWQFDSDFLLWDMAKNDWVQAIHKALVP